MKLTILTQYYPPEIGAPQRRLSELAERMVKAGHEVTVLTAMPNYPRGRVYEGYGGLVRRERLDGVQVIRTAIYPSQTASFVHRLTNYFSFVLSSAIIGTFLLRKSDYLLVESPPLFLGLSGIWLSFIARAKLIFNVSDLWPESAVQLGLVQKGSLVHQLSSWLEKRCYQRAWLVTGQSKEILRDIQARFPNKRTYYLSNGVDVEKFSGNHSRDGTSYHLNASNGCVALYAGLHGLAQGLDQLILAADMLRGEPGLEIVLIGDGPQKQELVETARRRDLKNIHFLDPMPAENVPGLLASADILLITLKSYIPGAVPSKLYEAMASAKPVVLAASGEPASIIEQYQAGIAVEPGDISGLVDALRRLRDNPDLRQKFGQNGRCAAEKNFNREKIVSDFTDFLETHTPKRELDGETLQSFKPFPLVLGLSLGLALLAGLVHFRDRWGK